MPLKDFNIHLLGKTSGETIVFLHGLLGSAANWRNITPAFEKDFRILTYDQRGHGKSMKPKTGYAPEEYADDLKMILSELRIPKAHIVGHSMGGRNAFCFAGLFPDKVEKLVIEDIGPEKSDLTSNALIDKLRSVPVPFENKLEAKSFLLNHFDDPKLGAFLYTSITVDEQQRAIWNFDMETIIETIQKGRHESRWNEVQSLQCPTLVIRGEKSQELTVAEFEKMQKINPRVSGKEVKDAGHWIHFEEPQVFIRLVQEFLTAPV